MPEELRLEDKVKVDKYKLHLELERNASDLLYYSRQAAGARKDRDDAATAVKQAQAAEELRLRRMTPEILKKETGLEKLTEGTVAALVEDSKLVRDAKASLSELQEDLNIFDSAVDAFKEKGSNVRALVDLHKTGYYNVPN